MTLRIVTDSTSDLEPEEARALGVVIVPLTLYFGDQGFRDRVDITPAEFYRRLAATKSFPRTSQPPAGLFEDAYRSLAGDGADEILSLHISSKLSGTVGSARTAAMNPPEGCRVAVLDSLSVAGGLGAMAMHAAGLAARGATASEAQQAIEALIPRHQIAILLDSLEYLQRGGRIGKARALLGGLLNVKPIVRLLDGEVGPGERVRSRRRGLQILLAEIVARPDLARVIVEHTGAEADAGELAAGIRAVLPALPVDVRWIGPVVGAYVGPGGVGAVTVQRPPA